MIRSFSKITSVLMSGALVASMLPFSLFQAVAENTDIVSNTNNM